MGDSLLIVACGMLVHFNGSEKLLDIGRNWNMLSYTLSRTCDVEMAAYEWHDCIHIAIANAFLNPNPTAIIWQSNHNLDISKVAHTVAPWDMGHVLLKYFFVFTVA